MITFEFFRKNFKLIADYHKCSTPSATPSSVQRSGDATYLFFRIHHPHNGRRALEYFRMSQDYFTDIYYYDSSFITEKLVINRDQCMALSKQHISKNPHRDIPEEHYYHYYFSMKDIREFEVNECSDIQGFYHDWFDMIFTFYKTNPTTNEECPTTFKLMVCKRDMDKFLEIFKDHPAIRGYFLNHML